MKRFLSFFLFLFFLSSNLVAQTTTDSTTIPKTDSLAQADSAAIKDSLANTIISYAVSKKPAQAIIWNISPTMAPNSPGFSWQVMKLHPYFGFKTIAVNKLKENIRIVQGKELLFYLLVFLFILFALLRTAFPKYFSDLFRLFFRTTLKQRQIKEQLMQTPLPSLLLNGFFVISSGLYIAFLLQHFQEGQAQNFWLLFLYGIIGTAAAYFIKFLGLKLSGWVFSVEEAANSYIFIVFIVNKMIGILLLPFLLVLAFTVGNVYTGGITISLCLIGGLLIYRFILTYAAIHNQVKVNPFHFFLYLCAFEIAPLLLIYKGLLVYFHQTA